MWTSTIYYMFFFVNKSMGNVKQKQHLCCNVVVSLCINAILYIIRVTGFEPAASLRRIGCFRDLCFHGSRVVRIRLWPELRQS